MTEANREVRWFLAMFASVAFAFVALETAVLLVSFVPWVFELCVVTALYGLCLVASWRIAVGGGTALARRVATAGLLVALVIVGYRTPFLGGVYLTLTLVAVIIVLPNSTRRELLLVIAASFGTAVLVATEWIDAPLPDELPQVAVFIRLAGLLAVTLVAMFGLAENARRLGERIDALGRVNRDLGATNKALLAFSHTVAHDLRNPIQTVGGFTESILEDCAEQLDEDSRDYLGRIQRAARRMDEIVVGLLALSDVQTQRLDDVQLDISPMALEILEDLAALHPDRVVSWTINGPLEVNADRSLIRVLLTNLIDNAWKYTAMREMAEIEIGRAVAPWGSSGLYVRDNGAGFDMGAADKLFEPFRRLSNTNDIPGSGIGLATVDRIVRRYGGTIRAESKPGVGTSIWFSLGETDR